MNACRSYYDDVYLRVGLSLVINIQQDQYVSEAGNTAGIIVLVQQQNLMPFPEDNGILVSPGYEVEVSFTMVSGLNSVYSNLLKVPLIIPMTLSRL